MRAGYNLDLKVGFERQPAIHTYLLAISFWPIPVVRFIFSCVSRPAALERKADIVAVTDGSPLIAQIAVICCEQSVSKQAMRTEIYIEALLVDEELADQVWELWYSGEAAMKPSL